MCEVLPIVLQLCSEHLQKSELITSLGDFDIIDEHWRKEIIKAETSIGTKMSKSSNEPSEIVRLPVVLTLLVINLYPMVPLDRMGWDFMDVQKRVTEIEIFIEFFSMA